MEFLAVGIVGTSHGVRGAMRVKSLSGEYGHFENFIEITLRHKELSRVLKVISTRITGKSAIIQCEGIDTPEDAKKYSGWEVWVARELCNPLLENEFYIADLNGCAVMLDDHRIGEITGVTDIGRCDLLEITSTEGGKFLVPFMDEYIGDVSIETREIVLREGWLLQ